LICSQHVSLSSYSNVYQRMAFKVVRFSICWSRLRLLLLLMMWILVNMNFPGHRAVMAFVGSYQNFPATCFLAESTTNAQRLRLKLLLVNGRFHQHQAYFSASPALLRQSPPRAFHSISANPVTSSGLFAYPQQSRSIHNDDDSVPKDIYIPEDQLDFSFVRSSVSLSILDAVY
jgi:hypothetical protein